MSRAEKNKIYAFLPKSRKVVNLHNFFLSTDFLHHEANFCLKFIYIQPQFREENYQKNKG